MVYPQFYDPAKVSMYHQLNLSSLHLKSNSLSFHTTDSANMNRELDLSVLWENKMKEFVA